MSWDNLRETQNDNKIDLPSDIDRLMLRLFTSQDGVKVLEYFKCKTIDLPSFHPGEDPSYGYIREGQNSIVREILMRVNRAKHQTKE